MTLFEDLKEKNLDGEYNESYTENGAKGFRTSGKELVDFNFGIASMRYMNKEEIASKFLKVWNEDNELALKFAFMIRDIREGLGERRTGRTCMATIGKLNKEAIIKNLALIPEYGRWDDILELLEIDNDIDNAIFELITKQIQSDICNIAEGKGISLLGKWLPSENASSLRTKQLAKIIRKGLKMNSKEYRKLLSRLRKEINIVEAQMCAKQWSEIDYSSVPSIANLRYRNCFLRNDETRRREFLEALEKGEVSINASVSTPVDIVNAYGGWYRIDSTNIDTTLEEMWKSLPDKKISNTLVVVDGSGSMGCSAGGSNSLTAHDVANAMAIYCAERNTGFENQFITFSRNPQLVDLGGVNTLLDKLKVLRQYCEVANTNIEKTFKLILDTAIENDYTQTEMPERILIISDMEFDYGVDIGSGDKQLFTHIGEAYEKHGFKLPRLVFWNVNSRSGTIPVRENDLGVALVSGFSTEILKMVMSDKLDPFEIIVEQLMSERYSPITL